MMLDSKEMKSAAGNSKNRLEKGKDKRTFVHFDICLKRSFVPASSVWQLRTEMSAYENCNRGSERVICIEKGGIHK